MIFEVEGNLRGNKMFLKEKLTKCFSDIDSRKMRCVNIKATAGILSVTTVI